MGERVHSEKTADGFKWMIPVFTKEQALKFDAVMTEIAGCIDLLAPVSELYKLYQAHTPKRLHSQTGGIFGAQWSALITLICVKFEEEKILTRPKNEFFTDQIIYVHDTRFITAPGGEYTLHSYMANAHPAPVGSIGTFMFWSCLTARKV